MPAPKILLLLAALLLVLAFAIPLAIRLVNAREYHYVEVDPGKIYRDGLRNPDQFLRSCSRAKIKTVISLVGTDEIGTDRFAPVLEKCRSQGITTLHVPIQLGGFPASADVQKYLTLAADPANQPAIAHCREGIRRTGMMVAAYQMSVLGLSREQAKANIQAFGHSSRVTDDINLFIDHYDPQTRTLSLPAGTVGQAVP
jgi:protein tyrosine phosphatase (PTP) superfamily phosphohydrolase (DUF442 family)